VKDLKDEMKGFRKNFEMALKTIKARHLSSESRMEGGITKIRS
jgi:hypothetical protein